MRRDDGVVVEAWGVETFKELRFHASDDTLVLWTKQPWSEHWGSVVMATAHAVAGLRALLAAQPVPPGTRCRRCSECPDEEHHFLPLGIMALDCKHCDVIARMCDGCENPVWPPHEDGMCAECREQPSEHPTGCSCEDCTLANVHAASEAAQERTEAAISKPSGTTVEREAEARRVAHTYLLTYPIKGQPLCPRLGEDGIEHTSACNVLRDLLLAFPSPPTPETEKP